MNSWKEIAVYLERGIRTVQRWHEDLHLPVHKIHSGKKSPVFAYEDDIDRWIRRHARDGMIRESDRQLAVVNEYRDKVSEIRQRFISPPPASARASAPETQKLHKKLNAELEQARQHRLTFMITDLDIALTLAKIAEQASDERKRKRNEKTANQALETVLRLYRESKLTDAERKDIDENITNLKIALKRLDSQTP